MCHNKIKNVDPDPAFKLRICHKDSDCKLTPSVCYTCLLSVNDEGVLKVKEKVDLVNSVTNCMPAKKALKARPYCGKDRLCYLK
jgi:hypothetical protein